MREELYAEMFEMEQRHWWFTAKYRIIQKLLARYLPQRPDSTPPKIADLGCGCGRMLQLLSTAGYDAQGVDGSPHAIAFAAQRGLTVLPGHLPDSLTLPPAMYDAVLLLDVLEHLEYDVASARAAANLLKPGGIFMATVPAYPWLWSPRDAHHQHFRRYSRKAFRDLLTSTQLHVELFSHFNTWLFPPAAAIRLVSRLLNRDDALDLRVPPVPLNGALRETFASESALLGRVPLPFGLSLIAIARKPA